MECRSFDSGREKGEKSLKCWKENLSWNSHGVLFVSIAVDFWLLFTASLLFFLSYSIEIRFFSTWRPLQSTKSNWWKIAIEKWKRRRCSARRPQQSSFFRISNLYRVLGHMAENGSFDGVWCPSSFTLLYRNAILLNFYVELDGGNFVQFFSEVISGHYRRSLMSKTGH